MLKILQKLLSLFLLILTGLCFSIYLAFNMMSYEMITISGNDMEPDLYNDDLIIIQPADIKTIDVDDIIVFKTGANKTTHKVVGVSHEIIVTQGSNSDTIDMIGVQENNLQGRMIAKIENGKLLLLLAVRPEIIIFLLIIIVIVQMFGYKKREQPEKIKKG